MELEWGAASVEALAFMLKSLCDRLAARLQGRAMAAARLELVLSLDRALCERCFAPSRAGDHAARAARARGRSARRGALAARAPHADRAGARGHAAGNRAGARCRDARSICSSRSRWPIARFRVWWPSCRPSWGPIAWGCSSSSTRGSPDERTRLAPFGARPASPRHPLVTSALEPTRLASPRPLEPQDFTPLGPAVRVEASEWWRRPARRRDLVMAWVGQGSARGRDGSLAWVELGQDGSGRASLRGWID